MVRLYRSMILLGAGLAVLVALASCGQNIPGSSSSTADSTLTHSQLSPTPTNMLPPAGEVTLRPASVTQYTISFTLANRTNQTILFSDHLTTCSVVLLELLPQGSSGEQWQAVAPCGKDIQTQTRSLAPGKDLTVVLTDPDGQWAPGLYRALLTYSPSGTRATPKTVFSPRFQVGSFNPCQRTDIACQASPGP